jgi:hypothetical protein
LIENEIARQIVDAAYKIHTKFGPGLLETTLRLADKRLGLLINFGEKLIKNGITRVANGLVE